jgi:hypothetical protein
MAVDVTKLDGNGWVIRASDEGGARGGTLPTGGGGGVAIPTVKDVAEFIVAIDRASSGKRYEFTRSDGAYIRVYPSERKQGYIVIERSGGNWVRLSPQELADLRLKLTRLSH